MRKTTSGMTLLLGCLNSLHCVQIAGAIEVGPITPVEDRIFIIDGSGSITRSVFTLELDIIREFTCGPNAPDPSTTPFGVQVIFFSDNAVDLISYRVISTAIEAQDFCNLLTPVLPFGGTNLTSALDAAIISFQTTTLAGSRHLFVLTDGGIQNQLGAINSAMTLRNLVPPVRICVTNVSEDCLNSVTLQEIANTELSPMFVPEEPIGRYGCTLGFGFPIIYCVDCACATDCNANGIFDAIDLSDGTSIDADGDLLPDECMDCNNNLFFDAQEIAADPALDCDANGILDECDLTNFISPDCNNNLILDECEISSGFSQDCNANSILDECELAGLFTVVSPQLSPIGLGFPVSYTFTTPPEAQGDVTMQFAAIADLASIFLALDVYLNDVFQGRIFVLTGSLCPATPDKDQLVIPQANFNALVGSGDATIRIETGDSVEFDACDGTSWISVLLDYIAPPLVPDVNGNSVPDSCDLARGDFNLDGVVNVTDLLSLLGAWGVCPGCPEDTNLDGVVNVTDLLTLLANWG